MIISVLFQLNFEFCCTIYYRDFKKNKYAIVVFCCIASICSFIPFFCDATLSIGFKTPDSVSPASSFTIEKCNVAMIAVSALMLADSLVDVFSSSPLPFDVTIPRWLMIAGIFSSSVAFQLARTSSPMNKLVLLINCYYVREFTILGALSFVVCGDFGFNSESKIFRFFQNMLFFSIFFSGIGFMFYPYMNNLSTALYLFTVVLAMIGFIVSALVCGYEIYLYFTKEHYNTGAEKFCVFHICCSFLYFTVIVVSPFCFGSNSWAETGENEMMSYFIIDLVTATILYILPSRMARYEGNIAVVSDFLCSYLLFVS